MKFTCNRDNLIEGINIVQRAISSKTTMPLLEGILLVVNEELKMTANDLDLGITYEVPAIIEEIGNILISAKTFGDIVRKLPDIYVTIETSDINNLVLISSGKSKFEIAMMDVEEYPPVSFLNEDIFISFEADLLKDLIKQSIFATAQDDTKAILKGVLMEKEGSNLNFVALDGNKMALKTTLMDNDVDFKLLVPSRILNELLKVIQISDEKISLCFSESQIMFFNSHFKIISRLIKGEFIKYRELIPREEKLNIVVSTKGFLYAIERSALIMLDSKKYPMILNMDMDEIIISAKAENGSCEERLPAQINGENITIGFNTRNFIDCLKVIDDDNISLSFTSSLSPCVVTGEEHKDFTFLVMPVRLKS